MRPLLVALLIWLALAIASGLGVWRLLEIAPTLWTAVAMLSLVFALMPAALLVWSTWRGFRRERAAWWVAITVVLAETALGLLAEPLTEYGADLNFQAHKPTYDALVADLKAGRLPPASDRWIEGRRNGVRYGYGDNAQPMMAFKWVDDQASMFGVVYDEAGCPPPPKRRAKAVLLTPLEPEAPPEMASPGTFYSRHVTGHYCMSRALF